MSVLLPQFKYYAKLLKLEKQHVRTLNVTVSSYASYDQFLKTFAERVMRSSGSWDRVKGWIGRFIQSMLGLLSRKVAKAQPSPESAGGNKQDNPFGCGVPQRDHTRLLRVIPPV